MRIVKIPKEGIVGDVWWVNPAPPAMPNGTWLLNFYKNPCGYSEHIYNVDLGKDKEIKPSILFKLFGYLVIGYKREKSNLEKALYDSIVMPSKIMFFGWLSFMIICVVCYFIFN